MKMNKIYIALALVAGVSMTGCDSLLDTESKDSLPASKLQTVEGCESMVLGVYDMMQDVTFYGRNIIAIPEVLADNCRMSQSGTRFRDQSNNVSGAHLDIWVEGYENIAALNEVIANVQRLPQTDKAKAILGESLFLRALSYFNLSIVYSREPGRLVDGFSLGVPLVKEPFFYEGGSIADDASPAREQVDVVWGQIEQDLNDAFTLLDGRDNGLLPKRGGALAAKALLSRVLLYQGKWEDCITASSYVIDHSPFGIYGSTYTDIFKDGTESLFQLNYTLSENMGSASIHSSYGVWDNGNRDSEGYGDGIGSGDADLCIAEELVALFDPAKDKRFGAMRKAYRNGEKLWWTTKFNSWQGSFGLDNIPIIRISEMYLNRAEAYAERRLYTEATADVNEIRTKRGLTSTTVTGAALLKEILLQRRLELAFEGHRFFDLKRRGEGITKPQGKPTIPYNDFRIVARIPETEMDVNKKLIDNPGY